MENENRAPSFLPREFPSHPHLKSNVAKAIHQKSADIYVMDIDLRHIEQKHLTELNALGISAKSYVKWVVKSFNKIMVGSDNSILLIVYNEELSHAAAVRLAPMFNNQCWKVTTAQPRRTRSLNGKNFLWEK